MNHETFRKLTQNYPFFKSNIFTHIVDNVRILRRQVSEWLKKGYILQLKRGMYTLRNEDRAVGFSNYFLANNLYSPSYVSLETALSYYGMIPERVYAITSISSKKTQHFENSFGYFTYNQLKPELYGNFVTVKDEFGNNFFIATPERAIIDFFYFKTKGLRKINKDIFEESFRLQNLDLLNKRKLLAITKEFKQKKLITLVNLLLKQIEEEKR
ncbi:MAG: hypothetical protein AB7F64_02795 [Gammaproteobacteria bacterium]